MASGYPIALEAVQKLDDPFKIERSFNSPSDRRAVHQEVSTLLIA